jgi:hypothetical protein
MHRRVQAFFVALVLLMTGVTPAAADSGVNPPVVNDVVTSAWRNQAIYIQLQATDPDKPMTFSVEDPAHGTVGTIGDIDCVTVSTGCSQQIQYVPDADFVGTDVFTFSFTDSTTAVGDATVTITYNDDATPPTLFHLKAAGNWAAGWTNSVNIVVQTNAQDPESGPYRTRISNSGTTSGGMLTNYIESAYTTSNIPWSLSNATGGSTANGTHTVFVQFGNQADRWSPVYSTTIKLDTTRPSVKSLRIPFRDHTTGDAGVPVWVTWTLADSGSGPGVYRQLQRKRDGGSWIAVTDQSLDTKAGFNLALGHRYQFRFRFRDKAGNLSAWKYTSPRVGHSYSERSSKLHYTGTWGLVHYVDVPIVDAFSTQAGATVTMSFIGRAVGIMSVNGPGRGKATIIVDGHFAATVDLKARSGKPWLMVFTKYWTRSSSHVLTIRVLGTAGRPKWEFDNVYTMSS